MNRILFGDNQFFGVNHVSDEKARQQSMLFRDDISILNTIDHAVSEGCNTFMCTTHDRMINIANLIRNDSEKYDDFEIFPCLPYAHKYANAVTELGIMGAIRQYVPGNFISSLFKGGYALVSKDHVKMMELMIDAELKMFKGLSTPVIFLQNVVTDLLLGLGMKELFMAFDNHIRKKYGSEPAYITMNMPKLVDVLASQGIHHPIVCSSINHEGFRMSGGIELYEKTLKSGRVRAIAMQIFSGGTSSPAQALEYVCSLPNVESILFGASSRNNIRETVSLIHHYDKLFNSKSA